MKKRVDNLLVERGLAGNLTEARAFIMEGVVWQNEIRLEKPGLLLKSDIAIEIRGRKSEFISRAGDKLKYGLQVFHVSPKDWVCVDIGSSTGGFTDCLLKNGANRVFSIDVGYGLLDINLRKHSQVTVAEKMNARTLKLRDLEQLSKEILKTQLLVSDVSFISLKSIIPNLKLELPFIKYWLLLFKPQFELPKNKIMPGGIVEDQEAVTIALKEFNEWMTTQGFTLKGGPETSPLTGKRSGNVEHLVFYELQ